MSRTPRRTAARATFLTTSVVAAAALALGLAASVPAQASGAEPVDGAQSVGDAMFPHVGNGGYDALHYDLDLRWSPSFLPALMMPGTFDEASLTMRAQTTGAPLKTFSMDFRGLDVQSVSVDGVAAQWTRDVVTGGNYAPTHKYKLVVTPATPVDGEFTVAVTYSGEPEEHVDADGSSEGWVATSDGATFLGQPIGAMTAFPHNNTPADKATYTIDVNVPVDNALGTGELSAVSNGVLAERVPTDGGERTTWRWVMDQQMASELMVISIGEYLMYEGEVTLSDGRVIPEWSFIDAASLPTNVATFEARRPAIGTITRSLEKIMGPYPGAATGVIVDRVPPGINYALETQDRSFFPSVSSFNGNTLTHEIAHQWYGDAVSPGLWTDIWINEGMGTWAPTYHNTVGSQATPNWTSLETTYFNSWNNTAATSANWSTPPGAQTNSATIYGYQTYTRGAQFWEALHTALRRDDFLAVLRAWQDTYAGTSPRGDRLKDLAEEISGRDLDAFWQDWIYDGDKPAWPGKYDLSLTSTPTPGSVEPGATLTHTLSAQNVGRVPLSGAVVEVDVSDLVDDAALGALPPELVRDGDTLRWTVPQTATGATASVVFDAVVDAAASGVTLAASAAPAAASLGGLCTAQCATAYSVATPALSPTADPVVTGTPRVGEPLTATTPGWADGVTFAYRWLVDGTVVDGATGATFVPRPGDLGETVAVEVTGTKDGFEPATRTSDPTAPVAEGVLEPSVPTVSGEPVVDGQLVADAGVWGDGVDLAYQWLVDAAPVPGETGTTYSPRPADVGSTVTVAVTGSRPGYADATAVSEPTAPVAAGAITPGEPTVSGEPVVDGTLTADPGAWDDEVELAYQWLVDAAPVPGETGTTYSPRPADVGSAVTVEVTGSRPGYADATAVSEPTGRVVLAELTAPGKPGLRGKAVVGRVLRARPGDWGDGVTLTYRWYAGRDRIPGESGRRLDVTRDLRGERIKVRVVGRKPGYTVDRRTSRLSKRVR